ARLTEAQAESGTSSRKRSSHLALGGCRAETGNMTETPELSPADMTLDELRPVLLREMLPDVTFDGWTYAAAEMAAERLDVPPDRVKLVFPNGDIDMVRAWLDVADADMVAALEVEGIADMKIRDRIRRGVEVRLEQVAPDREAAMTASRILARPQNAGIAARSTWTTADLIWRMAGDTSTDLNHYSKRAILSALWSSTFLYWLQDDSDDFADTRGYLARRIDNVMQFEKVKAQFQRAKPPLPSLTRFLGRLRYPGV
ncbi:MAG: COQ9 family protein, partial [Pacificimonas sp.]